MILRRRNNRAAFTLIELVASAVLAAMMMAALMSVVWSAVRESNQLLRTQTSRFPITLLVEQMRSDFHNARGMAVDVEGVTLHGFLGREPETQHPLLVPGSVRYYLQTIRGRGVLMRSDSRSNAEPVWIGISALQIEPLAFWDPDDESLPEPETGGLPEMPLSFQVTMIGDQGQILWREVVHHHAG